VTRQRSRVLGGGAAAVAIFVAALVLPTCYKTPQPDCAFLCGEGGNCPTGYFCAGDGACKRDGLADDFDCGFVAPADAAPPPGDGGIDAPLDAPPDAPADAGIDAS
jgi:hypothetical protein